MERPNHRTRFLHLALLMALVFTMAACVTLPLKKAKTLHTENRFEQLAELDFSCKSDDEGCNQLHLLKGDACFRLAKQTQESDARQSDLSCAADELNAGINMTKTWDEVPIDRAQVYANACEAARLRADFGDRSRYEAMLAATAGQFFTFAPDNPGAVYYKARAGFYTLTQSQSPCTGLKTLRAQIESALRQFPDDPHYSVAFRMLRGTVTAEQGARCGN